MSSHVRPFSTIRTIAWYRKSAISYLTSSGFEFFAAITTSVASSPIFSGSYQFPYQTDNSCKTPPLDSLYGLRSCHIPIQRSEADSSHHSQFLQAAGRSRSDYRYGMLLRSDLLLQAMYPDHSQRQGFTYWKWPLVSPFTQSFLPASAKIRHLSCLDRLIERSSFIYASIRISCVL